MHDRFKYPGSNPALGFLLHGVPGLQVVGQHPPGCASAHNPPQYVEDFAQTVLPLRRIFAHRSHVRSDKRPFIVTYIARIGFSFHGESLPCLAQSS